MMGLSLRRWYRHRWWAGLTLMLVVCWHPHLPAQLSSSEPQAAPAAQVHPLPSSLAKWRDPERRGDYFDQIKPTKAGYLVWSTFPIHVYVGAATATLPNAEQTWRSAVVQAIQDWQPYLPLAITEQVETADIRIEQRSPAATGGRVRSAVTRYQLYIDDQQRLRHRSTIQIRPNQTAPYITAAVRHELGHALGLWGHSPNPKDVLYFSQVRQPPPISARDVNTLKRVYEQPTRLGWPLQQQTGRGTQTHGEFLSGGDKTAGLFGVTGGS